MQETAAGTPAQRREALRVYRDEWHTSVWADAARLKIKKKGAKVYVSWRMPSNNYTVITPCLRVETLMIELCWLLTCLTTDDAESALEAARNCRRICETWANVGDVVHYMQEFSARYYIDIENIISAMIRMTYEGYETCLHVAKNSRFPNVRVWGETVASMTFVSMCDRNAERLAGNGCLEEVRPRTFPAEPFCGPARRTFLGPAEFDDISWSCRILSQTIFLFLPKFVANISWSCRNLSQTIFLFPPFFPQIHFASIG